MAAVSIFLSFLLGLFFLATGAMKLVVPHEQGRARIGWITDVPSSRYRAAGWLEAVGGVGLMFPTMVQAFEWLTPIAAAGLMMVMGFATRLHVMRREPRFAAGAAILVVLLALVAISSVLA
ncbi:MAG: DoxX family protein [Acidimicrobiia bacterium]|nr:DoxX family protein [Acidimicrobiia bacterium]